MLGAFDFEDKSLDCIGEMGDTWPFYPWLSDEEIDAELQKLEETADRHYLSLACN